MSLGITPKYVVTSQCGHYPPMEKLRGKDGKISMYLMQKREGQPGNTPPMRLQAARSYNFTELKDYYKDGDLSGFTYGYPPDNDKYRCNGRDVDCPFKDYKKDAYLFCIEKGDTADLTPKSIELIILEGAKMLAPTYCRALVDGLWNGTLKELRSLANNGVS